MKVRFIRHIGEWKPDEIVELSDLDARRQVEQYGNAVYIKAGVAAEKSKPAEQPEPIEKPTRRRRRQSTFHTEDED